MKTIISVIVLLYSVLTYSQNGWELLYGGDNIYAAYYADVSFFDAQTGWVLNNKFVMKTTNSGMNWKRYTFFNTYSGLSNWFFLNKNTGWIVQYKYLHFTSNGGDNWSIIDTTLPTVYSMFFLDQYNGWLSGYAGLIKKTTNGGVNWVFLNSQVPDNLNSITFTDQNTGICAGDWGTILNTTNGGLNWSKYTDINLGFFLTARYLNAQTCFAAGTGGNILRSTNGGINWTASPLSTSTLIRSVEFSPAGTGYAAGNSGMLFKTTNLGNDWQVATSNGLHENVFGFSITPGSDLWIATDSSIIGKSSDAGNNWTTVHRRFLTYETLNSVHFFNSLTGLLCGEKGTLFTTTNGGYNWTSKNMQTQYSLKDICFTSTQTGYICGGTTAANGIIFKTTNAGEQWNTVYQDSALLTKMYFLDSQTGWAAGSFGVILKTTNAGNNWIRTRHVSLSPTNGIFFQDENTGYIGKQTLYRTTNGGTNWTTVMSYPASYIQFFGSTGYYLSNSGTTQFIAKSTNSGLNWDFYATATTNSGSLFFVNSETGWVTGGTVIKKTTNGGLSWQIQNSETQSTTFRSIFFTNENYGWIVGSNGAIMRTGNGGIGIQQINSSIPNGFELSQNYPNPFNPTTKIKLSIPLLRGVAGEAGRGVLLKVYDVLGKEIAVLVNENLKPGIYEIEWDASNIPSGVYFYSLISNEFTQTKKMVVLK
ncbi:MAG: T9SS type A sorting domain-containing protein [Ignavibacteria bacterium]|nr:T9SS type A sorting domain-containing protein [Ignavibacteria bacterium]